MPACCSSICPSHTANDILVFMMVVLVIMATMMIEDSGDDDSRSRPASIMVDPAAGPEVRLSLPGN